MVWPTANVSTTNLDQASDSISSARADLYEAVTKLNEIIQTGGVEGNISSGVASVNGYSGIVVLDADDLTDGATNKFYTDEKAEDAAANLFVNGTHSGITFTYNDASATIDADVSGSVVDLTTNQTIAGNKTFTGFTTLNEYRETVYTGGSVTTYTPDLQDGPVQTITLTGNFTLNAPVNMLAGTSVTLIVKQDATGNRIMTPNTAYLFAGGINTLSVTANVKDIVSIFYDGTDYLTTLSKGYV